MNVAPEVSGPAHGAGPLRLAALAAAGAAAGVLAQRADSLANWSSELTSFVGLWVVLTALVGLAAPTAPAAAISAALFLLSSVAGYYVAYAIDITTAPSLTVATWGLAAVTAGPLVGVAGHLVRGAQPWNAIAAGAVSGLLAAEALWLLGRGLSTRRPVIVAFDLIAAAVGVALATRLTATARERLRVACAFAAAAALYLGSLWLLRNV